MITALTLCGCEVIHGSGNLAKEERDISTFERVVVENEATVKFVQAEEPRLVIKAEDNIIGRLTTKVRNGTLVLGAESGALLDPTLPIEVAVEGPSLRQISVQGSGSFACETLSVDELAAHIGGSGEIHLEAVETDTFEVDIPGSGEVTVDDLTADDVSVTIAGSGDVGLAGNADTEVIQIGGSGSFLGSLLEGDDVSVDIAGSGDVEVFAKRTLTVNIDGSGSVRFKGDPSVSSLIAGSGSVTRLD